MRQNFALNVSWLPPGQGPDEVAKTSSSLEIAFGDNIATRSEDLWSQSVQSSIRVSIYPLAMWLASSWWRLRWEAKPAGTGAIVGTSWRMAHETAAAGYGFLWPQLTLASDGESIEAACKPSNPLTPEPIHYLADFLVSIDAACFERTVDGFINTVLARLDALGVPPGELHRLWAEVLEERTEPKTSHLRKLEAQLGFEAGEAPEDLVRQLSALGHTAGSAAASELASVCAGPQPAGMLHRIIEFASTRGQPGRVSLPSSLMQMRQSAELRAVAPWDRGRMLAQEARHVWGLGDASLADGAVAGLLNIPATVFDPGNAESQRPPVGLAIRENGNDSLKLLFQKRNRPGRRFEAARFIADHIASPNEERWLPVTGAKTAIQKEQRAFAAEFLCPIAALEGFLDGDFSSEAIEDAGQHFGVSELAVKSHLANHRLIPSDEVAI